MAGCDKVVERYSIGFATPVINHSVNELVRKERLELSQVTLLEPKSSASTNSATFASTKPNLVSAGTTDHYNMQAFDFTRHQHEMASLRNLGLAGNAHFIMNL
jgi:hypothetical protein